MNEFISQFLEASKQSAAFYVEAAKIDFALELNRLLERRGMTKAALARAMGVSKPMVTKVLRGDANLTIETMVKAARAAGGQIHVKICDENADGRWFELLRSTGPVRQVHDDRQAVQSHHNVWASANDNETQPLAA